jgi:hypothetical protein
MIDDTPFLDLPTSAFLGIWNVCVGVSTITSTFPTFTIAWGNLDAVVTWKDVEIGHTNVSFELSENWVAEAEDLQEDLEWPGEDKTLRYIISFVPYLFFSLNVDGS